MPSLRCFTSKLAGSKVFSKFDLRSGYYQIPLSPQASAKTVTVTPWGSWRFTRLPMGIRNAAQSLQKMMDHVISGLGQVYCYMDDLLVFTPTEEEHLTVVEELFRRLEASGLAIHPDKAHYARSQLEFLGFNISQNGITPLSKKVEAITNIPPQGPPRTFWGFWGR